MSEGPRAPYSYLGARTFILDDHDNQVAVLDVPLWPPVGSVIELGNPNRDAVVTEVRLQLPQFDRPGSGEAVIFVLTNDTGERSPGIPYDRVPRSLPPLEPPS